MVIEVAAEVAACPGMFAPNTTAATAADTNVAAIAPALPPPRTPIV
jgi:hypothetical protein